MKRRAVFLAVFTVMVAFAGAGSDLDVLKAMCIRHTLPDPERDASKVEYEGREAAFAAEAKLDAAFEEARGRGNEFARQSDVDRIPMKLAKLLKWRTWRLGTEIERIELFRAWYNDCVEAGIRARNPVMFEKCAAAIRRGAMPATRVESKYVTPVNLQPHSSFELGLNPHGGYVSLPFSQKMVQPKVSADETTAFHGRRSLKIDNRGTGGEVQLVMAEAEVMPERGPFVVSAYVKADRPTKVLLGVARVQFDAVGDGAIFRRNTMDVGTEWKRIALGKVVVSAPVSGFAVQLGVASDAVVWVDAVQVERSDAGAGDYAPSAEVEASFVVPTRILTRAEDSSVSCEADLCACTYGDKTHDLLFDTDAGRIKMSVRPGKTAVRTVRMAYARNGIFTLGGTFENFENSAHDVSGVISPDEFAVVAEVPAKAAPGYRIGACGITGVTSVKRPEKDWSRFREGEKVWRGPLGYSLDEYYRDLRRGGYSVVRMHDGAFDWQDVEREKGKFDWALMDMMVSGTRRHGLELMPVFASHSVFRTRAMGDTSRDVEWFVRRNSREGEHRGKTKGQRREDLVYYHPLDSDWTDWIRAVVTRYHDRIRLWEIVNEPDGTMESAPVYSHYAELCYKTVKSIAPDSTVIGVCSTGDLGLDEANFFRRAGEAGAFQWLDAASFHPYAQPLDYEGKDGEEAIANLRAISDGFRKGVPFWETELYYIRGRTKAEVDKWRHYKNTGDPRGRKPSAGESKLFPVGNLVKRYAIDLGCGCAGSTTLSRDQHRSMGPGRSTSFMGGGVIGFAPTFAVSDLYLANAAFARYLEGAKPLAKPKLGAGFNGYKFQDRHGRSVVLVWKRPGEDTSVVKIPEGAVARDVFGNRLEGSEILVSGEPVYIFAPGGLQP